MAPCASFPTALVDSTTRAATRFLTVQTIVRGSATSLAQGVLRSMTMTRWLKAASVLLVAGATVAGVDLLAQRGTSAPQAQTRAETPGRRSSTSRLRGEAGATDRHGDRARAAWSGSRNQDVYCNVEGRTTIITIVPEGTRVKKGDIICELDSAALRDQLINQRITTESAEAAYQNAKLAREVAEIAVREYNEGIYKQEQETLKGEIAAARSAIQKAESRLERTRRARQRLNRGRWPEEGVPGRPRTSWPTSTSKTVSRPPNRRSCARRRLSSWRRTKQELLEKYTRGKTIKALEIDVEQKRSEELAKAGDLGAGEEQGGEAGETDRRLHAQGPESTAWSSMPTTRSGSARHASDRGGRTVRERQKILSIARLSAGCRSTPRSASRRSTRSLPNMKAKIRVDAFADQLLNGSGAGRGPPARLRPTRFSQDIKVYTHQGRDRRIPCRASARA